MFIRMKNKWTDEFEGSEIIKEVYQIYDEKKGDDIDLWAFNFEGFPYCVTKDMIIAQADDIEKLFDEIFFVDDEDNFPHTVIRLDNDVDKDKKITECRLEIGGWVCWLKDYQEQHKGKIKGAIYTEKGIIYVAEMNDQGDWNCYEINKKEKRWAIS